MKNIYYLLFVGLLISACQEKKESQQKPNFVFILVDDLGWADVKANYSESFYETSNLDQMQRKACALPKPMPHTRYVAPPVRH